MTELEGIDGIEELIMDGMQISSLSGIENLGNLRSVSLSGIVGISLEPLTELPYLKTVTVSEDMSDEAAVLDGKDIEVIYQ